MQTFGRLFGSRRIRVEGRAEELRGKANVERAKLTERVERHVQQAGERLGR